MRVIALMTLRTLKRSLSGTLFLMVGLFVFELVQPMVADSVGGGEGMAALIERLPAAFQSLIKAQPEFIALSGLPGYLSLGFTHPLFYVLTSAAVVTLICRSIAGELESGTLQLAFSRPVSRTAVYASRVIAIAVTIGLMAASALAGMVTGLAIANPAGEVAFAHLAPLGTAMALLMAAIGGVTLAIASASDTTSQAVGRATGFVVVSFVINYLAAIWSVIEPLDPISIFAYYSPAEALIDGRLYAANVIVLSAVAIAGAVAGAVVFSNRDLPS